MVSALAQEPHPYVSQELVIGAGFGREWTSELDAKLVIYACKRAAELGLPGGPLQLAPLQLLPPPGRDGATRMPASFRRTASSSAPGEAAHDDAGFGAPPLGGQLLDSHSAYYGPHFGDCCGEPEDLIRGDDDEGKEGEEGEGVEGEVATVESVDDDTVSEATPLLATEGAAPAASSSPAAAVIVSAHSRRRPPNNFPSDAPSPKRRNLASVPQAAVLSSSLSSLEADVGNAGGGGDDEQRETKPSPSVLAFFSREALEQRFCALLEYNNAIAAVLPLIDFSTVAGPMTYKFKLSPHCRTSCPRV